MIGWLHWLNRHEFEQAPGVGEGQGSLACFSPWGHKELDTTEWLNWTELRSLLNNILKYYSTYKYLLNEWVRLFQFHNQKKDGNLHFWIFFHIHLVKWALLESLCGFLTLPLDHYHMEDICIISLHALIIQECCFCFKDLWRSSKWREGK